MAVLEDLQIEGCMWLSGSPKAQHVKAGFETLIDGATGRESALTGRQPRAASDSADSR